MLDGVEEEADELEEVEAVLFDFVHFVDRFDFIFIQQSHQVRQSILLDERRPVVVFQLDDTPHQLL